MAATTEFSTTFGKGDRVVLNRDLPGLPEGTGGKVKLASGLTWQRYWVDFDGRGWVGSVSAVDLVAAREWERFKRHREEEARRAAEAPEVQEAAAAPAAETEATGAAAGGAASRIPAHLLERSRAARARKTGG
jgi:hypothetical protein